ASLAALLTVPRQTLAIVQQAPPLAAEAPTFLADFGGRLRGAVGADVETRFAELPQFGAFTFDVYLRLSGADWLHIRGGAPPEIFAWPWHMALNLALMVLVVLGLGLWAARSTVRPLSELAEAARRLAEDLNRPPLREQGPSEAVEAAQAFNTMQRRIRDGIEERERFLAAVSHDLKTPVTRMRLRAELLPDAALRERFDGDLRDMQQLLDGALDLLRGRLADEARQPVDLVALAERVVEDFSPLGTVSLKAPEALRCVGQPQGLERALSNLIDNALKYGRRAEVEVRASPDGSVVITVDDVGPGIPPSELERVFEPFHRLEASRSRETGGSGLGLAIVRQVARSHGGDVTLANRPQGGLRATLTLPPSTERR
ncbi:MAG TPA: ATP-binding protein, partial [Rubrivivax sp.]|nr:ATP-binding protein [Rubrivivax sp.]